LDKNARIAKKQKAQIMKEEILKLSSFDHEKLLLMQALVAELKKTETKKDGFLMKIFSKKAIQIVDLERKIDYLNKQYFRERIIEIAGELKLVRVLMEETPHYLTFKWLIEYQERIRASEYPEGLYRELQTSENLTERLKETPQ